MNLEEHSDEQALYGFSVNAEEQRWTSVYGFSVNSEEHKDAQVLCGFGMNAEEHKDDHVCCFSANAEEHKDGHVCGFSVNAEHMDELVLCGFSVNVEEHKDDQVCGFSVNAEEQKDEWVLCGFSENAEEQKDEQVLCHFSFNVCGKVTIDRIPESLGAITSQRRIIYSPEGKGSDAISKVTDAEGKFCVKVKPGKYVFNVSPLIAYSAVFVLGVSLLFHLWRHESVAQSQAQELSAETQISAAEKLTFCRERVIVRRENKSSGT